MGGVRPDVRHVHERKAGLHLLKGPVSPAVLLLLVIAGAVTVYETAKPAHRHLLLHTSSRHHALPGDNAPYNHQHGEKLHWLLIANPKTM
jgi:hypothetical protein